MRRPVADQSAKGSFTRIVSARSGLVESIAMRRLGTPDDIVHGVLFFASDFASWITGQVLSIDGGR